MIETKGVTMDPIEEIKKAINDYFSDTSRSKAETKDGLEELQADIEGMLDALRADGVKD